MPKEEIENELKHLASESTRHHRNTLVAMKYLTELEKLKWWEFRKKWKLGKWFSEKFKE